MYGQEITTETDNLAPLLKVSHTLQHHELQHKVEQMGALNELIVALAICKSVFFVVFVGMAWVLIPRLIRSLTVRCCQ